MDSTALLLSFIVFAPVIAALALVFFPKGWDDAMKLFSLGTTFVVFLATVWIAIPGGRAAQFEMNVAQMQDVFSFSWMPSFNIYFFMGIDGISFPLVVLTSFITMLAMWASWPINKHVKAYCCLFLLLETGMLGVFMALDFFLFYIFWELMLLPMYFLIGVWGGPRREYAAIKFFLFTLLGGVFMLIAVLMLYFTSDLKELAKQSDLLAGQEAAITWSHLHLHEENVTSGIIKESFEATTSAANGPGAQVVFIAQTPEAYENLAISFEDDESVSAGNEQMVHDSGGSSLVFKIDAGKTTAADIVNLVAAENSVSSAVPVQAQTLSEGDGSGLIDPSDTAHISRGDAAHTFNLLALAKMGQYTNLFDEPVLFGKSTQWWAFLLLFVGFIIKVPSVPLHTWLPDAHVEAPTPISMILAGVLLKMGGYGIIRICYPICPDAGYDFAYFVTGIGLLSMVYGAFAAMAQKDFKRLVAYSSVSHMGYVVLGLGVWSAREGQFNPEYWQLGANGAMFQMLAHGISSAGMFFMVGVIYDRVHHRNLDEFGGLFAKMPVYSGFAYVIFFAGLGLPGLCGFIGEFFVTLSVWNYSHAMAIISASVVILTAGYILWTLQRVFLGPEYKGPHEDELRPITAREVGIAVPLVMLAVLFGVYPRSLLDYMEPSVNQQISELADWTQRVKAPRLLAAEDEAADDAAAQANADREEAGGKVPAGEAAAGAKPAELSKTGSRRFDLTAPRPPS